MPLQSATEMRGLYKTNVELAKHIELERISHQIKKAACGDGAIYPTTSIIFEIQYPDNISTLRQSGYTVEINGHDEYEAYKISW